MPTPPVIPGFLHPVYLAGLAAASTPIVIYLLLRRRRTEVPWGASYLLRRTLESQKKTSVWKQYVVLALRCLLLACVALTLAEPFRPNPAPDLSAPEPPPEPIHRVVLVDHSLSMSATQGTTPRLTRAKEALGALLRTQRPGDLCHVVSLIDPDGVGFSDAVRGRLAPSAVRTFLDQVTTREGRLRLPGALAQALTRLSQTPRTPGEIVILSDFPRELVSDFRRLGWFQAAIRNRPLRILAANMSDPAEAAAGNVTLSKATFGTDLAVAGVPATLHVNVVNRTDSEVLARLQLSADRIPAQDTVVTLQPNESKRASLNVLFPTAGTDVLRLRVAPSLLPPASELCLSLDVRDRIDVWLLADEPDPTQPDVVDEAEFLRRAMEEPEGRTSGSHITEVRLYQLANTIPETTDVVLLAGPRVVTPAVREPLLQFVRRGGGLVVALSPSADLSFYNPNLQGLLPATLVGPARPRTTPDFFQTIQLQPFLASATPFEEFANDRGSDLSSARFYNLVTVADVASPEAVLFQLMDHQPLLLHHTVGRGHVLLLTSSLGISWASLPVRRAYIPFLYRLILAAASGRGFPRNCSPGGTYTGTWPDPEDVTLTFPDQEQRPWRTSEGTDRHFIVVPGLDQRGVYRITGASGHTDAFAVSWDSPESDLRPLAPDQQQALESLLGTPIHPSWPDAVRALGPGNPRIRFWPYALLFVVLIYLVETWFARYV